jgi:hypothetical protein
MAEATTQTGPRRYPNRRRWRWCEACERMAELQPTRIWIPGDRRRRYFQWCGCPPRIVGLAGERGTHEPQGQA